MYKIGKYTFKAIYNNKDISLTVQDSSEAAAKQQVITMLSTAGNYPGNIELIAFEDTSKQTPTLSSPTNQYPNYTGQSAESWLQQIHNTLLDIKKNAERVTL